MTFQCKHGLFDLFIPESMAELNGAEMLEEDEEMKEDLVSHVGKLFPKEEMVSIKEEICPADYLDSVHEEIVPKNEIVCMKEEGK